MKTELSPAMEKRLAKLAKDAGRTPAEMLPYVLQDGFEFNEDFVRKVNESITEADAGKTVPHAQVMKEIEAVIQQHGRPKKAA